MRKETEEAIKAMKEKSKDPILGVEDITLIKEENMLSVGISLINLALSGRTTVGITKGRIYRFAGRSQTGKSFLARTVLAEAAKKNSFSDYQLIYDDVEYGVLMDTEKYFGRKLCERLVAPAYTKEPRRPMYSRYVSDFYKRINKKLDAGKKLIWIEDSLDSLTPNLGSESKMTDGKARANSQELRRLLHPLQETGSILILVSQVRADMHAMPSWGGPQDIISGGMAPEFYASAEIILKRTKTLTVKVKERNHPAGYMVQAHIKKNRISGKDRKVYFPFNPDIGLDDVGANVDYLIWTGHWEKIKGSKFVAEEFDLCLSRDRLVRKIEETNQERELQVLTGKVWNGIEAEISKPRKRRYN